ncbi:MAG: Hsp20/alpha crystallin family protein [Planctomycetota bacterium]|jgi:HSP20 family protein|nr:Hsp20/alpha crystallin family protein [Planctomycetota bacterium]
MTTSVSTCDNGTCTEPSAAKAARSHPSYRPNADIYELEHGYQIAVALPGVSDEGLEITVEDDVLSLRATSDAPGPDGMRQIHREYRTGNYYRRFALGGLVDRDGIQARLVDGVLTLDLPKREEAKPRRIHVN